MLKKTFLASIAFISFAGCTALPAFSEAKTNNLKSFSESDSNITVEKGTSFVIKIKSNASTGYSWALSKPLNTKFLKLINSEYQNAAQKSNSTPVTGAPGFELWKFSALKKGSTQIKLMYHRPWEKDVKPSQELTFKIKIN